MRQRPTARTMVMALGVSLMQCSMAATATSADVTEQDALWAGIAAGVLALGLMSRRLRR